MTKETAQPQRIEILKESWAARNQVVEGSPEPEFKTTQWLSGFYDYYFAEKPHQLDREVIGIAQQVLGLVKDKKNTPLVNDLQVDLATSKSTYGGPIQRTRQKIGHTISRVKSQYRFETLLHSLEAGEEKDEVSVDIVRAASTDDLAKYHIETLARSAETLGEEVRDQISEIAEVQVTAPQLEDTLITLEIAKGDLPSAELQKRFAEARVQIVEAFGSGRAGEVARCLVLQQDLLRTAGSDGELVNTLNNLHQLSRTSPSAWRRQKAALEIQVGELVSEDHSRGVIISDLIKRGEIDPDSRDYLEASAGVITAAARVVHLEGSELIAGNPDQRKEIYAACLKDLVEKGVAPTLIEDIVNGQVNAEDLGNYLVLDWLSKLDEETRTQIAKASVFDKAGELLSKATSVAAAPLGVLMALLELRPNIPGLKSPLSLGGGGGASLELGNPFEGVLSLGNAEVWKLSGFPADQEGILFRLRSSSTFNLQTGNWEDDTEVINWGASNYSPAPFFEAGKIEGAAIAQKSGFYYIPMPYGCELDLVHIPGGHRGSEGFGSYDDTRGTADFRDDGSVGFDLDTRVDGQGYERAPIANIVKGRTIGIEVGYKSTSDPDSLNIYPFDREKALVPLISSLDVLPDVIRDIPQVLTDRAIGTRTEEEIGRDLQDYVRTNFQYSLDPANKAIYDQARREGPDAFMRTLFEFRKVKCDGAATAMIALLRYAGIPARLAVGYKVDSGDDSIRGKNAHGWVEALVDGKLMVFDPTPENRDQKTEAIMRRSDWMSRLIESIKLDRWTEADYDRLRAANNTRLNRMFKRINPGLGLRLEIAYEPFKDRRLRRKTRRVLEAHSETLKGIESHAFHPPNETLTSESFIGILDVNGVMSQKEVRGQMIDANTRVMLRPAIRNFVALHVRTNDPDSRREMDGRYNLAADLLVDKMLQHVLKTQTMSPAFLEDIAKLIRVAIFDLNLAKVQEEQVLILPEDEEDDRAYASALSGEKLAKSIIPQICFAHIKAMEAITITQPTQTPSTTLDTGFVLVPDRRGRLKGDDRFPDI